MFLSEVKTEYEQKIAELDRTGGSKEALSEYRTVQYSYLAEISPFYMKGVCCSVYHLIVLFRIISRIVMFALFFCVSPERDKAA